MKYVRTGTVDVRRLRTPTLIYVDGQYFKWLIVISNKKHILSECIWKEDNQFISGLDELEIYDDSKIFKLTDAEIRAIVVNII